MADATSFEQEVARLIVEALNLEDVKPESIDPEAALFREGLGLDSIDALEVVFQVQQHFGVVIRDMKEGRPALQTINSLAALIEARL